MLFRRTVDGGKELVQQRAIAGRRAAQEERRMRESKREKLRHQTLKDRVLARSCLEFCVGPEFMSFLRA